VVPAPVIDSPCAGARDVERGVVDVARDEARRDAQAARGFHHQQRVVAAAAAAERQRLQRRLRAFLVARLVFQALADVRVHAREHLARAVGLVGVQELVGPADQRALAVVVVVRAQVVLQVQALLHRVGEGQELGGRVERELVLLRRHVLDGERAHDAQLGRLAHGLHQRHGVGVRVLDQPGEGLRAHLQVGGEHAQVVAVARTEHHAVQAEGDRLVVAIDGGVL
jgi:hypothetical protein